MTAYQCIIIMLILCAIVVLHLKQTHEFLSESKQWLVILRGIHYDPKYRKGDDYQYTLENFRTHIIQPLEINHGGCDVMVSTYKSSKTDAMIDAYRPKYVLLHDADYSKQSKLYCTIKALEHPCVQKYRYVFVFRFDLYMKQSFTDLLRVMYISKLNLPFKEVNDTGSHTQQQEKRDWKRNRVGDAVHVLPVTMTTVFVDALRTMDASIQNNKCENNGHQLYNYLPRHSRQTYVHFMYPSILDSNPDSDPNPVYDELRIK
jgi:hypothetical protein